MTHAQLQAGIQSLSPEEAGEVLNAYAANFHRPPPAPLQPSTPAEASARLAQLSCDQEWCRKLTSGDIRTADEFYRLSELAASAAPFDPSVEGADWSSGEGLGNELSRRNQISWAEDARARGFTDEQINFFLGGGKFTRETVALAQSYLPRMEADPTLLYSDWPQDRAYQLEAFRWILAAGTGDMP
jgi:hypothetical protein